MNRIITFLALASVSVLLCTRCADPGPQEKSLLFRISGKGLTKPSYLFGTHHIAPLNLVDDYEGLWEAFDATDVVVGELLLKEIEPLHRALMNHFALPDGESYEELLSEEDYKALDEWLISSTGLGLAQVGKMHPGTIQMYFTSYIYAGMNPGKDASEHLGMDQYLQLKGERQNKQCVGLETVDDQIYAMFLAQPLKEQARSVAEIAKNMDYYKESVRLLLEAYQARDLDRIYELSFNDPDDPTPISDEYAYALNQERNDKWLVQIPSLIKNDPCFIAVGALHLAGEEGLVQQLRKMGYKVEAVV